MVRRSPCGTPRPVPEHRRAARELALRVLYQVDVGRRPVRSSLNGALDQLVASVRSGLTMAVRQSERRLRRRPDGPTILVSATTRREQTRVIRHVVRALEACAEGLGALVEDVLAYPPRLEVDEALARIDSVVSGPLLKLQRTLRLSTLSAEAIQEADGVALNALAMMRTALCKRLRTARASADMLAPLVTGTSRHREELDALLGALTAEWPLERQPASDRNILRLAAYELLHCPATPAAVVMNEAVELAKRYGTEDSGRFVNGVLAALTASVAQTECAACP